MHECNSGDVLKAEHVQNASSPQTNPNSSCGSGLNRCRILQPERASACLRDYAMTDATLCVLSSLIADEQAKLGRLSNAGSCSKEQLVFCCAG